jgi:hypothetical protein
VDRLNTVFTLSTLPYTPILSALTFLILGVSVSIGYFYNPKNKSHFLNVIWYVFVHFNYLSHIGVYLKVKKDFRYLLLFIGLLSVVFLVIFGFESRKFMQIEFNDSKIYLKNSYGFKIKTLQNYSDIIEISTDRGPRNTTHVVVVSMDGDFFSSGDFDEKTISEFRSNILRELETKNVHLK